MVKCLPSTQELHIPGVVVHAYNFSTREMEAGDQILKVTLGYIVCSRPHETVSI